MNIARLRNTKAFTLIELIVVIVVIGILIALGAFAYQQFIEGSRNTNVKATATQVAKSIQAQSATAQSTITAAIAATPWDDDLSETTDTPAGSPWTVTASGNDVSVTDGDRTWNVCFADDVPGAQYTVQDTACS